MAHAPALDRELPPGFRFHPTDEEIITHYLTPKVIDHGFAARAVGEVDLNKCEPWDLPRMAKMGGKEMYFFCQRDRKYPTGMRTNRATESGYWKATGKDKEIYRGKGVLVGMKKTLVFYKGRAPKGGKTNWVMHEFRIEGKHSLPNVPKSAKDEWVVSRVFHKNNMELKKSPPAVLERIDSFGDDPFRSTNMAPDLRDPPYMSSNVHIFDMGARTFIAGSESDQNQQMLITSSNPPHDPNDSAYYSLLGGSANPAYLHHIDESMLLALTATNNGAAAASAVRKHCKVEPYCSSHPPHDAGLNISADRDTDIGSAVPKHYSNLDEPWAGFGF